jgi:Zn-dependent peptidase ImmA (M78 family)
MTSDVPWDDFASACDWIAAEILAQADIHQPPIDALAIAKRLGMTVARDDRQTGRARTVALGASSEPTSAILLKRDPRHEREQWAIAHEVGEAHAEKVFQQSGIDPLTAPRQAREYIANAITSRLVLPQAMFFRDAADCNWDLFRLKEIYATASHELITRRMLDGSVSVIVSVYDQNRLSWRRTNLSGRLPKISPLEDECRRRAHQTGETIEENGPPAVRVWPIHEPLWKREIVRVELDELAQE